MERGQGSGDDTALNAIALFCKGLDGVRYGGKITSSQGIWGSWHNNASCHDVNGAPTFLTAFALHVERNLDVCISKHRSTSVTTIICLYVCISLDREVKDNLQKCKHLFSVGSLAQRFQR